jgi:hypothetical protein
VSHRLSPRFVALPIAAFFLLGILAASLKQRQLRRGACFGAHVLPMISMIPWAKDWWLMLFLLVPLYVAFAGAWLALLRPGPA